MSNCDRSRPWKRLAQNPFKTHSRSSPCPFRVPASAVGSFVGRSYPVAVGRSFTPAPLSNLALRFLRSLPPVFLLALAKHNGTAKESSCRSERCKPWRSRRGLARTARHSISFLRAILSNGHNPPGSPASALHSSESPPCCLYRTARYARHVPD